MDNGEEVRRPLESKTPGQVAKARSSRVGPANGYHSRSGRGTPAKRRWKLNPEYKPSVEAAYKAGLARPQDPKYMNRGERERYYARLEQQVAEDHADRQNSVDPPTDTTDTNPNT